MPDFPGSIQDRQENHERFFERVLDAERKARFEEITDDRKYDLIFPSDFVSVFSATREEWAKMLPFIQAFVEGTPVYSIVKDKYTKREFWKQLGDKACFTARPLCFSLKPPESTDFLLPSEETPPSEEKRGESPPSAS